jgi:HEAT repeat protein
MWASFDLLPSLTAKAAGCILTGVSPPKFQTADHFPELNAMTESNRAPVLLNDEQIRQFIANGYIKIDHAVPAEVHATITRKLNQMVASGPNLGNNVLPQVPEFRHVLNSPPVRGALISLLGEDYIEHPHRYCHDSKPKEEKPDDIAAAVARQCHQDSYTPMSRPRQHYPRYARIIYYPQDTPIELGPTHVTPGTSCHKLISDEDRYNALPMKGPSGSLWITHFDIAHAAGVNLTETVRQMIKFIYIRCSEPKAPAWNCQSDHWQRPRDLECAWDLDVMWSHFWDWMCGKENRYDSFFANTASGSANGNSANGTMKPLIDALGSEKVDEVLAAAKQLAAYGGEAAQAVPALVQMLNKDHQAARAAATYALGAIGAPAVATLIERLEEAGRQGWEEGAQAHWNEGTVLMMDEAHALGAIGAPAITALINVLETAGEWGRINAAFALGEMDSQAVAAIPALTACLEDDSHRIVRTAIDALGTIGGDASGYVARMSRFLTESRPDWEEGLTGKRSWMARDQVRVNSATAMARLGPQAGVAEEALIRALDDPCGYVGLYAQTALQNLKSPTAEQAVLDLVMAQRWDSSLSAERPW